MQVETSVDFGENAGLFGATNETNFEDLNQILSNQVGQKKKKANKKKDLAPWVNNLQ